MSQKIVLQTTNFETNDIIEDVNVDAVKIKYLPKYIAVGCHIIFYKVNFIL